MPSAKCTRDEHEKLHSFNGNPAVIDINGDKLWYQHGKRHRENDPAVIYSDGTKYWYQHDKLHREDGPAVITNNGNKYWYIHGKEYTFNEWAKLVSLTEEQKTELLLLL